MKKIAVFIMLFIGAAGTLFAQRHLAVELDHPVYHLLETGQLKGAVHRLSMVKPYSRAQIREYLAVMRRNNEVFTPYERDMLQDFIREFAAPKEGLRYGNFAYRLEKLDSSVLLGADFLSNIRLNTVDPADWHIYNLLRGYLMGDLSPYFSYYGCMGFTFDKVGFSTYAPYGFTKEWDAVHIGFGDPRYSITGAETVPYFSYYLKTDLALSVLDNNCTIRVARHRREWSYGEGSFSLSESARPFMGLDIYARLAPWIGVGHLTGSLTNWQKEGATKNDDSQLSYQKNYTLQTLEFFPFDWLRLSANASVLWGKRLEIGYMVPLVYSMIYQNLIGDFENVGQEICANVIIPRIGSIYFSFFADEMEITNLSELFVRPRNMFALQGGVKVPIPKLPFTVVTIQYTKIEPFVYTHYAEDYPFFSNPVDMAYTHDGEGLGYHLPSNSDEWLVKIETLPHPRVSGSLEYRLIRHGTNDPATAGEIAIYGDLDVPLNYGQIPNYPDKDFLHDGIYDWNNIITLAGQYTFKKFPLTLGGSYCFAHTFCRTNATGLKVPDPEVRNVFSVEVSVFR